MFIRAIAPAEFAIEEHNYYVREARYLEDTGERFVDSICIKSQ